MRRSIFRLIAIAAVIAVVTPMTSFAALMCNVTVAEFSGGGGNLPYYHGMDISHLNDSVDASKVQKDLVVIRIGGRGYGTGDDEGKCYRDSEFTNNINNFSKKNCKIALYWITYSVNEDEVKEDNTNILDLIGEIPPSVRKNIKYLFIDREPAPGEGRADTLDKSEITELLRSQITRLQETLPNMKIGLYSNYGFSKAYIDFNKIGDVPFWYANYVDYTPTSFVRAYFDAALKSKEFEKYLRKNMVMWQYTRKGIVSGVEGWVDLNLVSTEMLR